jgi:hypothetical protein
MSVLNLLMAAEKKSNGVFNFIGQMSEWFKVLVLKTSKNYFFIGSNPILSGHFFM